jgi:hypothetical protein
LGLIAGPSAGARGRYYIKSAAAVGFGLAMDHARRFVLGETANPRKTSTA